MLHYLNAGVRRYGERPVNIYHRERWEFQAVVHGACGPLIPHEEPAFHERHLWVFGPEHRHGWAAPPESEARIVVAHFDHVPDLLSQWVRPAGVRSVALSSEQAARLEALVAALLEDFHRPNRLSGLRSDHALLELSMLAMQHEAGRPAASRQEHGRRKVAQALAWYAEHLPEQPGVEAVAAAVFVSPSHLRRLFASVASCSPLTAMHRVQVERACELMRDAELSLTEIAPLCGYASLSAFSRSFRTQLGVSPTAWRSRGAG